VAIAFFVLLPKWMIAFYLMLYGNLFLLHSEGDTEVLLNAIALLFVLQLDEIIFALFVPARLRRMMEALPDLAVEEDVGYWSCWRHAAPFAKFGCSACVLGIVIIGMPRCGYDGLAVVFDFFYFIFF